MNFYRNESSNPKHNAQRNLCGRTHYVDDDTLRFHKSRVISARHVGEGLLFAIVTSDSLNYEGTKRGFRYVIFDIFGNVLGRTAIEDAFRKSDQATKAMWAALNAIDAKAVTLAAIKVAEKNHADEMYRLRLEVNKLGEKAA
jgi:hypothetical protein